MIREATGDARCAARQFAEDSGSRVGGIRNAQQSYFSITDRDAYSPQYMKVRVVTTVQYSLEDDCVPHRSVGDGRGCYSAPTDQIEKRSWR